MLNRFALIAVRAMYSTGLNAKGTMWYMYVQIRCTTGCLSPLALVLIFFRGAVSPAFLLKRK